MKYEIISFFRTVIATLTAFLLSIVGLFGGNTQPDVKEANQISGYSAENADYTLDINAENEIKDISELLFGIFFEDINFAADGGLYAEMVANRSFEYTDVAIDDQLYAWTAVNNAALNVIKNDSENYLNENNVNFLVMKNSSSEKAGISNRGFLDGMSIEENKEYNLSFYAKAKEGYSGKIYAVLAVNGNAVAEASVKMAENTEEWTKYELTLTSTATSYENVSLQLLIDEGEVYFDMISLFPEDTYKGRENGLRKDLAEMLEELQPKFLRFPGGCITEGYDDETAYDWKDSIGVDQNREPLLFGGTYGDVAARKQSPNLWTDLAHTDDPNPSFMTYGLGFYEYFLLCEDIGAIGVPVLNCGLFCQMRGRGPVEMNTPEFQRYIDDMLDLIEFCRGDENTVWGKVRIEMGHEEPFELKYICIGNENEGEVYFERYTAFLNAFNEAKAENPELYEGLELIYSAGTADGTRGAQYLPSYQYAKEELSKMGSTDILDFAGATDQHYYNDPIWFFKNADYYDEDNYSRDVEGMTDSIYGGALNVFLGEYAAKSNRLEAALAEAAYMTGLERNGDIVTMAAYAPLFGNLTATHWSPDLIWFNNHLSTGSISYYMQKLFSTNAGTSLLDSKLEGAQLPMENARGRVGVGTWYTSAEFDNVKVVNNDTGCTLGSDCFLPTSHWWGWTDTTSGDWGVKNGKLVQKDTWMADNHRGAVTYFGDTDWENYTYTVEATKLDGSEGFIIPFAAQDTDNYWFWNIGGWGNTVSCLQEIENGIKTGRVPGTVKDFSVETGRTYEIKVVVNGYNAKGYIDGELMFDKDLESGARAESYQVVSTDASGDIIIKLVNVTGSERSFAVDIANADVKSTATVYQVAGDSLDNDNILGAKEDCIMEEFTVEGISNQFNYTVPMYSATVIRVER